MAKRIFDLAKELQIPSKAIIEKCIAEGVPVETVKTHMSPVKAGLEASIREWFAASSGGGTAVETTAHVDAEAVKTKTPRRRSAASKTAGDDGGSDAHGARAADAATDGHTGGNHAAQTASTSNATGYAGEHAPTASSAVEVKTQPQPAAPLQDRGPAKTVGQAPTAAPTTTPTSPSRSSQGPGFRLTDGRNDAGAETQETRENRESRETRGRVGPAGTSSTTGAPAASETTAGDSSAAAQATATQATSNGARGTGVAPIAAISKSASPGAGSTGTSASAKPDAGSTPDGEAPVAAPSQTGGHLPAPGTRIALPPRGPLGRTVVPAPQNVPSRPNSVSPAGQQVIRQQVKLSGPKVIRVENPEPLPAPRPARTGGFSHRGPMTGTGVRSGPSGPGGPADRNAGRNNRRGPGTDVNANRNKRGGGRGDSVGGPFSEQDLADREDRLARSGGLLRRIRKTKAAGGGADAGDAEATGKVQIQAPFTIKELAEASGIRASEIIKRLFQQGIMATVNVAIDPQRAQDIMIDFDIELDITTKKTAEEEVSAIFQVREQVDVRPRAPVVTIMGHVDHGKTSLLDKIRKTNVASGEAGGITQKTSVFRVSVDVAGEEKPIVFLDTPGHQAFTEMRSRGANLTDIIVLVISAADGVMPQTVESINHAKAAKVPIVVALNKIDSPQATPSQIQKIYGQLAEHELSPQEWGGSTELVKTSALNGTGISELLETLDLQAQVLELKAGFSGPAQGRVVEASRDEGRGPLATVLLQQGKLKVGDFIVVGRAFGRVRGMTNDQGKSLKEAGPSMPVQISGMDQMPDAGDPFFVTGSLRQAEEAAVNRRERERTEHLLQPKVTLDSLLGQMKDAAVKEILIVLKADVQGSVDVIKNEVERLSTTEVKIRVLHAAVGGINESDVQLSEASKAVIVGFNVIPSGKARSLAEQKGVEIRTYQVIYDITEDVKKAASGLLEPEIRQEVLGHAEVRKVYAVSRVGTIAGCYITDGMVQRDALIRVTRQGVVIVNDRKLEQLKRFKDDAKDVKAGMECGMKIVGYDDIKEGDVLECYKKVEIKRTL